MKKFVLLFFAILFVWLPVSAASLGECVYEGFRYSLQDNGFCTLTAPAGPRSEVSGDIVIPAIVNHKGRSYRVLTIGTKAFYKCLNLRSVEIPYSVKGIRQSAFEGCKKLESIHSSSATTILNPSSYAFKDCSNLSVITNIEFSINLDPSFMYADRCEGVFQNCSKLKTIDFTYDTNNVSPYFFQGCSELSDITLPPSVKTIERSAFEGCRNLKSINLNDGVVSIDQHAFAWSGLTSVNLSGTVSFLSASPFLGCHELKEVYIGDKLVESNSYSSPFLQCINLNQITVSDDNPVLFSRDNCLYMQEHDEDSNNHYFYLITARSDMETYTIPADFNGFLNNFNMDYYIGILSSCTKLTSINNLSRWNYMDCGGVILGYLQSHNYCSVIQIYGPNRSLHIPFTYDGEQVGEGLDYGSLIGSYNIESVIFGDDFMDDKICTFDYCTALKTVRIPDTVKSISGFNGCTSFESIQGCNNLEFIQGFNDCTSLEPNLVLPSHLKSIDGFDNCTSLKSVVFPDGMEKIWGFDGCHNLTVVKIPCNVKTVSGFDDCMNLSTLSLPDGLESLRGFSSTSLASVKTPESCRTIEDAFNSCDNLENVEFSDGLTEIRKSFSFCDKLKSITFPNTLKTITGFNNCYNLGSVKLGINVQTLGSNSYSDSFAFNYCPNLKRFVSSVKLEDFGSAFTGDYFDEFVIGPSVKKSCDIINNAKKIYSTALIPPTIENSQVYDGNAELYIRSEAYDAYMKTSPWKQIPAEKVHRLNEIKMVNLDVEAVKANPGHSFRITYTLQPADADLSYVYWRSSNPEIATVDEDGLVTFTQPQDSWQTQSAMPQSTTYEENDNNVICEIQAYTLYSTEPVAIVKILDPSSSIEGINGNEIPETADVYNLQGILIRKNATRTELDLLPSGIYIYGGLKIKID